MALISSVSMTLMVNGTLQSEFFTMFCPIRLTYSVITGSVISFVLFSISSAYPLPILISPSVEYQLPTPRPPILRVPTAFTSSMLPALTCTSFGSVLGAGAFSDEASGVPGFCVSALGCDAGVEGCWPVAGGVADGGVVEGAVVWLGVWLCAGA